MKVMKFGGSSLADAAGIKKVSEIIADYYTDEKVIVVVSAVFGVTDLLVKISGEFSAGNVKGSIGNIAGLFARHIGILRDLGITGKLYRDTKLELKVLFGQLTSQLMLEDSEIPGWNDNFLSFGEKLAATLVTACLKKKRIQAKYFDSARLIVTNEEFGNACPLLEETEKAVEKILLPAVVNGVVPVITGFFGCTLKGDNAILGRGGSDYSATILAYALDAEEVILWKEVNGIYSEDPKLFKNARFYPEITYGKATSLAQKGAKILHPQALMPVEEKEIVVWIKNTFNPENAGSKIWKG